jgi:multidrug transporter EmrE-like cation transporter
MNIELLIILASIVALLPIFFIKEYIKTNNKIYIIITILSYVILMIAYINIFKKKEIMTSYTLLQILQIIIISIISIFIYNEKLTIKKIAGLISGLIAIYYLQ